MKSTTGFQDFLGRSKAPATYAIIGLSLAVFVLSFLMRGKLLEPLIFVTDWSQPWGLITYPFANGGIGTGLLLYLIELYWLFWVGTSTERDLGWVKYLGLFFASSAVAALFIWFGAILVHPSNPSFLAGLELPIAALTVAWGTRHPHESILLFAIIPMPGWILAWLTVALTFFGMGTMLGAPLMGLFASLHLGLVFLFASNRIPGFTYSKPYSAPARLQRSRLDELNKRNADEVRRREKEREERERLRKLFEGSIDDDRDR